MFRNHLTIAILCLFSIGSAACNSGGDAARGSENSSSAPSSASGGDISNSAADDAPRALEAKWYQDADGNAVPDFIEIENGYDPARDDCDALDKCGDGATGEDLDAKPANTLLMLDSSGSMRGSAGGTSKIEAAKTAISNHVKAAPAKVRFGFLVYGHKGDSTARGKAESCQGIELIAPVGGVDKTNVGEQMAKFGPVGYTPIGAALRQAREAFAASDAAAENHIILVSDGIETCGGDPVGEAKKLREENFKVTVDVVGLGVSASDAAQLKRIAEAGGGTYSDAKTAADLDDYFKRQAAASKKAGDDGDCNSQAFWDAGECDNKLFQSAVDTIARTLQNETARDADFDKKLLAYEDLKRRMLEINQERRQRNMAYLERMKQLFEQGNRINRQTIENFDRAKP